MEQKDLLKKQKLAEELDMKFEEVEVLFSDETLDTMRMGNFVGGSDYDNDGNFICIKDDCHCTKTSKCGEHCDQDKSKEGTCGATIEVPELPVPTIPPIISPTVELPTFGPIEETT